jgi:hypothetical protein
MKTAISKYISLSVLIIVGLGGYCQADTKTDTQTKTKKEVKKEAKKSKASDIDLPVIKLKIDKSGPSNPNLKKGKGCEDLEEAKGEVFKDYPMAKTVPCEKVDCKDLKPAPLQDDNYKELPTTKTDGSCEGDE